MERWQAMIAVDPSRRAPVFVQIAQGIGEGIRRGVLQPGERLPGSRALAEALGVHRNTAQAAYADLEAQGWVQSAPSRGTFVSGQIPASAGASAQAAARPGRAAAPGYALSSWPREEAEAALPAGALHLRGGLPDLRELPLAEIGRALRRAALARRGEALKYAEPQGYGPLRRALAALLRERRALLCRPEEVLVTRGAQMALALAARALIQPGQVVAVEAYGYAPAWAALRAAGAQVEPLPVDEGGLVIEALERLLARTPVRALYVTPHHQYPTTVTLQAGRRLRLLALARAHGFAILEDDYDNEFHYDGAPVLPLASADAGGAVIYVGSLSKVLAPGLRLGYAVAPWPVIEAMTQARVLWDRQGDLIGERALTELIEEGTLDRHIRRMRRLYQDRRDALVEALRAELGEVLRCEAPPGGLSLWAQAPGVDTDAWAQRALARGVAVRPESRCHFGRQPGPHLRLGFAALRPEELREAVARLKCGFFSLE
jgi:GntR family transcriptional regulator/MocR family aminotransferase